MAAPRIFDVYLGSGAPTNASSVSTSTFWERDFRSKSPHIALAELRHLHDNYGISQFNFLHDNFANKRGYLERVHHLLRRTQSRLPVGLRGSARTTSDSTT